MGELVDFARFEAAKVESDPFPFLVVDKFLLLKDQQFVHGAKVREEHLAQFPLD